MSIFFAPAYPDQAPLAGRFAPEAKGMLAVLGLSDENTDEAAQANRDSNRTETERIGSVDSFALNPPDDSIAARLGRITALLRRGDPRGAMDRAALLLNGAVELSPDHKFQLRQSVEAGLHDLTIAGRMNEAHSYRMLLIPALQLEPAPSFAPQQPSPLFSF